MRILTSLFLFPILVSAAEWPQWRGPDGQGHAPDATNLPAEWSETENVVWRTEIPGRGHSSPVIDGNQIWLTTAFEKPATAAEIKARASEKFGGQPMNVVSEAKLHAICVDRETGEIVRNVHLITCENPQFAHKLNSYASPTPVLADGILYTHFGSYGTAALDTKSGEILWSRADLEVQHENGPGSTPVIWENLMIFHMDGSDKQFITALDRATGKTVWETARTGEMNENPQLTKAYGTPLITEFGGKDCIVSPAADWLYFYDPATGKELHKYPYGQLGFSNVARAVVRDGVVYMPTGFMQSSMIAVRYDGKSEPELLWQYDKAVPKQPSPVLIGEELFFVDDKGVAGCLDAGTGEEIWRERLDGNFNGSPLFVDGKLYLSSQEGKTVVIKPGRTFEKIAENEFDAPVMASAAAVGEALYFRTEKALYRIEKKN